MDKVNYKVRMKIRLSKLNFILNAYSAPDHEVTQYSFDNVWSKLSSRDMMAETIISIKHKLGEENEL